MYINQLDDREKAQHVPLMSQIYASADLVYAQLGPNADDSDLAMREIGSLNVRLGGIQELNQIERQTLLKFGLPTPEDPIWPVISRLFHREWFTRVRVIQQVLLAKAILVICGSEVISSSEAVSVSNCFMATRLTDDVLETPYGPPELRLTRFLTVHRRSLTTDFQHSLSLTF